MIKRRRSESGDGWAPTAPASLAVSAGVAEGDSDALGEPLPVGDGVLRARVVSNTYSYARVIYHTFSPL